MALTPYELWHKRLKRAADERRPHENAWRKIHKEVVGPNYRITDASTEHRPQPLTLSNNFVRLMLPRLLPKDRLLRSEVSAKRPDTEQGRYSDSAKTLADRINAVLDETRAIDEVRRALRMSMYSAGILQMSLNVRTGIVADVKSEKSDGGKVKVDVDKERIGGEEFLDAALPVIRHIAPDRLLPASGATSLSDARWVAVETFHTIEAIKADPLFMQYMKSKGIDPEQLKPTHDAEPRSMAVSQEREDREKSDPQLSLLQVFEIHDRASREVIYMPGEKSVIKEPILVQQELPIEGLPFALIGFEEVDGHFWPNPPMGPTHDGKKAASEIVRFVTEAMARTKTVIGFDPDNVKDGEMAILATASDGAVVPIKGLSKFVQEFKFGGFHPDLMQGLEMILRLNDLQDGLDEIRRGVAGDRKGVTATEVRAAESQGAIRVDDMRSELDKAVRRMVEIMAAVLVQLADMFQDVSLPIGDPTEAKFIAIGGQEEVVGSALDYAYEIKITTQDRVDPAIRLKRTETAIGVLTNPELNMKLQAEGFQLAAAPVIRDYLEQLGHRNPDKLLINVGAGPDPNEEAQRAMAEDQAMTQNGQVVPASKNDDHEVHLQVHMTDYEQTQNPAIAEHASMHEMLMQEAAQGQGGGAAPAPQAGPRAPAPPQSPMAAQGTGDSQAAGQQAEARRL